MEEDKEEDEEDGEEEEEDDDEEVVAGGGNLILHIDMEVLRPEGVHAEQRDQAAHPCAARTKEVTLSLKTHLLIHLSTPCF